MAKDFEAGEFEVEPDSAEVIETDASEGTATISIRLPRSVIAALKSAAEEEGIGATVLARRWIMERLATSERAQPTFVDAAVLVDWVLSHARSASADFEALEKMASAGRAKKERRSAK